MRYLLNFLLANLVPIIIVASIAIRILRGMRNSAASRKRGEPPVPVPDNRQDDDEGDVWSRLKPDNEDDDEDQDSPPIPAYGRGPGGNYGALYDLTTAAPREPDQPQAGFSRPLLMPAPSLIETPPPPPVSPVPGIGQPFDPVAVTAEPGEDYQSARRAAGQGPLDRLNSLPPLRRAVVMAEILGPPKGLA
jgi:hypothetical protein